MQRLTESIIITDWASPRVRHAVNWALNAMDGTWDAASGESRDRFLGLVREAGFPAAELVYLPAEGRTPRVHVLPEGRP